MSTPLTEAEELELLELEAELGDMSTASAPAAPPRPDPSRGRSFALGASQGATFGFADELGGLLGKMLIGGTRPRLGPAARPGADDSADVRAAKEAAFAQQAARPSPYQVTRDLMRDEAGRAEAAHRGYYIGGNLAGGLATMPLMPGPGGAKTLGQLAVHGMKLGAGAGAAFGFGSSKADLARGGLEDIGQATVDTSLGALLGGALGAAAPPLMSAAGWAVKNVASPAMKLIRGGYVTPTPEAQRLMEAGAKLTLGRMDPASTLGRFEEIATSKATGGSLKILRDQADETARDAILRAAGAPGAKPPTAGSPVAQQLEELAAGFTQVYDDALGGARIQPDQYLGAGKWRGLVTDESLQGGAKMKGAFELAADSPSINASDEVRRRALAWLKNEATSLAPTKTGAQAGTVEARAVQQLRTRLRDEMRSLGDQGDDRATKQIIERAEEFVTELLEGQLPAEQAGALRAADGAYRNLLATRDAAKRAFVQDKEFTPGQMLQAIRQRGATPELEAIARDAHNVLTATYPLTGVQGVAGEVAPLSKLLGPGFAHASNVVPWLRQHALVQKFAPGVPARAASTLGRAIESAGRSPRAVSATFRTLVDLLSEPQLAP